MEIIGLISIGLGAMTLLAFSLSGELAAFFPGYAPLVVGGILVIAGLALVFVSEVKQKKV
jgi:hypothetical protein